MSQAQPLTVLIVDDELPLREELRSLPWSDFGAELVGEAEHGEEALIACDRLLPDVVITDITMPVMDGFELFRALRSKHPLTQVILLTCHSEFHFAREALKLGALEYLVKMSFGDKELGQALDKAREAIRRERNARMSERSRWRWELSFRLSRAGDGPLAEPLPLEREIAYPLRVVRLHVASNAEDRVYALQELQCLLEEREWAGDLPGLWMPCGESDIVLLAAEDSCALSAACGEDNGSASSREAVIVSWTERLMSQLYAELEKRLPYLSGSVRLYAVVSGRVETPAELPGAIRQAAPEAGMLFYDPPLTAQVLPAPEAAGQAIHEDEWEQLAAEWRAAASCPETYARFLRETFDRWARTRRPEPAPLKRKVARLHESAPQRFAADAGAKAERIMGCATLAQLVAELIHDAGNGRPCRREVREAMRIVRERLAEPLTLTSVAEEVRLSSHYLSRLFREETGISFNEYVTRLRMERAIELLQTTPLKVYEVAEAVGIPSYRYFSVLFRQHTGVVPTEYKKG